MTKRGKLITVKVGSNVITNEQGFPDSEVINSISRQIVALKQQGHQVILISSGAVAAGRSLFKFNKKTDTIIQRQVLSSLGQVKLISQYTSIFHELEAHCAQVLVTKEDFRSRNHYLNMQNCLHALLTNGIVPIINENDVVSVTELMFTDNDELAGLVSSMMNADKLIILTNVDGVYDGDPTKEDTKLIHIYDSQTVSLEQLPSSTKRSGFGRGGILTKCHTAEKIAAMGIPVHIANGRTNDIMNRILQDEALGTLFPAKKVASNIKKYIAQASEGVKGKLVINAGAKEVLLSQRASSLLPVGVTKVVGSFKKGDIVSIVDENDKEIGMGIARTGSKKAKDVLGMKNQKPIIHYDHLYLH